MVMILKMLIFSRWWRWRQKRSNVGLTSFQILPQPLCHHWPPKPTMSILIWCWLQSGRLPVRRSFVIGYNEYPHLVLVTIRVIVSTKIHFDHHDHLEIPRFFILHFLEALTRAKVVPEICSSSLSACHLCHHLHVVNITATVITHQGHIQKVSFHGWPGRSSASAD